MAWCAEKSEICLMNFIALGCVLLYGDVLVWIVYLFEIGNGLYPENNKYTVILLLFSAR